MKKNYRVIRSTYKGKHSYMISYVKQEGIQHDEDFYIEGDSIEGIKAVLESMLESLGKLVLEEKTELVEIEPMT